MFEYYGLDWLGTLCTFLCIYLVGEKKRSGFVMGFIANLIWLPVGLMAGSYAIIIANFIYGAQNILGYYKWTKEQQPDEDISESPLPFVAAE